MKPRKFRCEVVSNKKRTGSWLYGSEADVNTRPRQCNYEAGHAGRCNFATTPLIEPPVRNPYPTWFETR